ncbi:MAG TPA: ribonuclease R, partial [Alcanivorax sp.]|nr:ribonuclease R [Alcanivorax sp.]
LPLVTIDDESAKDFDDAVYVESRQRGGWRLIVAIADVSHYVHPGTALDNEAHKRGNSVYFPNRVVPMLPEALSNGLCSLNPHVDRLCLYCDMLVSANGRISRFVFREGVMRSRHRLTYNKVGAIIEEPESELATETVKSLDDETLDSVWAFHEMYLALRRRRELRGAIDFESNESRILFDEQSKIRDIV